jgi:NAD(P)-dependent dehydrogenase (short-subunit alcohol dehydrogenase family)
MRCDQQCRHPRRLTRQLAVELAPFHIRVNTFAPGPTRVERNLRMIRTMTAAGAP